jgi:hypothetical protein
MPQKLKEFATLAEANFRFVVKEGSAVCFRIGKLLSNILVSKLVGAFQSASVRLLFGHRNAMNSACRCRQKREQASIIPSKRSSTELNSRESGAFGRQGWLEGHLFFLS